MPAERRAKLGFADLAALIDSGLGRISASGVRNSCDTFETKSDFSRATANSLLTFR